MFYSLLKPLLFALPPERAHDLTIQMARLSPALGKAYGCERDARLAVNVGQNRWGFPVGLAAGLDKNCEALNFLAHQGFGSLECGTITLQPQLGNPKPRLFRYPQEESLRNAMGFPNHGLLEVLPRLKLFEQQIPLGANIGKNKDTSPLESIEELNVLFESLQSHVDYFVINVSSPNTPGLRAMQEKSYLLELFTTLNQNRSKDLFLKIAPDLEASKVIELAHLAAECGLTGLMATNTTIMPERGAGGVSGRLLTKKAQGIQGIILKENLPIEVIGIGGISETSDLFDFWAMGGKACEVYTAYVYQGPELLRKMKKDILKFLTQQKLKDLDSFFALPLLDRQESLREFRE